MSTAPAEDVPMPEPTDDRPEAARARLETAGAAETVDALRAAIAARLATARPKPDVVDEDAARRLRDVEAELAATAAERDAALARAAGAEATVEALLNELRAMRASLEVGTP